MAPEEATRQTLTEANLLVQGTRTRPIRAFVDAYIKATKIRMRDAKMKPFAVQTKTAATI